MNNDKTSILVTGINWMGAGIGSIETAMEHLFQDASDELLLTVYSISTRTDLLFDLLDAALSRGVQTKMVINSFEKQPRRVVKRLRDFVSKYPHFLLHGFSGGDQSDLHAKVIVADRKVALVGSSNLSWRGMVTNYELAALVRGDAAGVTAQAVDRLLASENVVRVYSDA
jgi:phosphatidylserine/phosphatidylglycerophosphate/cardiolipin synthase-like enzyme